MSPFLDHVSSKKHSLTCLIYHGMSQAVNFNSKNKGGVITIKRFFCYQNTTFYLLIQIDDII